MGLFIQWLVMVATLGASLPVAAELYRWVDERGVTNYSNAPPPVAAMAKKLAHVSDKMSVYTPDEHFMQAVKAMRERSLQVLTEPELPRNQVMRIAAQPQSGYEQCLMSGRPGCEESYRSYYQAPFLPAVGAYAPHGVQPTRFLVPRPVVADATRVRLSPSR